MAVKEKDHYRRELIKLETRKKDLIEMRMSLEINKEDYKKMKDTIENQITALNISRNEAEIDELDIEMTLIHATKLINDAANQW